MAISTISGAYDAVIKAGIPPAIDGVATGAGDAVGALMGIVASMTRSTAWARPPVGAAIMACFALQIMALVQRKETVVHGSTGKRHCARPIQ